LSGHPVGGDDPRRAGQPGPWIAAKPTPPQPMTSTLSPGRTAAVRITAPTPVVTPQPNSAARSSGSDSSTGTTAVAGSSVCSASDPTPIPGHTGPALSA